MKLVLNAWLLALIEGLGESVALAEGLGVDPAAFLDIIDGGPLGPPYAKMKGTMMIERSYEPSFSLALAAKDAGLALDAAEAAGLDLPALRAIRSAAREGGRAGPRRRGHGGRGGGEPAAMSASGHALIVVDYQNDFTPPSTARWRCRRATRSPRASTS